MIDRVGVLRGVVGSITWQYYTAAAINGYTIECSKPDPRDPRRWLLRATVVLSDAYKLTQRPLIFEAPHKAGAWRWPIQSYTLRDGALVAVLGDPLP